jgi:hypothetical protein
MQHSNFPSHYIPLKSTHFPEHFFSDTCTLLFSQSKNICFTVIQEIWQRIDICVCKVDVLVTFME